MLFALLFKDKSVPLLLISTCWKFLSFLLSVIDLVPLYTFRFVRVPKTSFPFHHQVNMMPVGPEIYCLMLWLYYHVIHVTYM